MDNYDNGIPAVIEPTCRIRFITDPHPEEDYIAVPAYRMRELLASEMKLLALESGGVDNWEWYGQSICDYLSDLPNCYDKHFWDWVNNEKAVDQTAEDFVDDMNFDDFAEYEVAVM